MGIGSLILARFAEMENIHAVFAALAVYIVTVVVGNIMHGLLVLPGLFFAATRTNPYRYLLGLTEAMATAFGTDSR